MINVNQITSQLARMPDQALQKYAQMHKNDPYIMALAMSESNRRKDMRGGAQMNAPQQPKIVDQAIQSMAAPMPENVGIGQLPAGNMNFADGGIVAFSDGGDVPRYQSQGLVQGPAGVLRRGFQDDYLDMGAASMDEQRVLNAALRERLNAAQQRLQTFGLRQRQQDPTGFQAAQNEVQAAQAALAAPAATAQTKPAAPAPASDAAPKPDTGAQTSNQRTPPAGGPGASAQPPTGLAALPIMQSPSQIYQTAQESVPLIDPAAGMREDLGKEMISGAEGRTKKLREDIAAEGDVFAGRGERIGKREEKLKEYELTNKDLAFINAGLAIMSTPGGLATAIGKGARVGTEQYAAGLDKIRAAQERLEDAKDNLDTLRLNRSDMNKKEIRASEAEIDRAKIDAKKLGIEGIMAASDLRHKQASELFKGVLEQEKTRYTVAGDLEGRKIAANATMAAANAPGSQERMFNRLGGGDLRKGMQAYSDIMGTEAKGETAMIAAYAKDPVKLKLLEQTDPALAQLIKSRIQTMMVPGAQNAPGPGGARP